MKLLKDRVIKVREQAKKKTWEYVKEGSNRKGICEGGIQQKRGAIQSQDYQMYQKSLKVEL